MRGSRRVVYWKRRINVLYVKQGEGGVSREGLGSVRGIGSSRDSKSTVGSKSEQITTVDECRE